MRYEKRDNNYNPNYNKIMGMSNAGFTPEQIAIALDLTKYQVLDVIQRAYGRSLMFGKSRMEEAQ